MSTTSAVRDDVTKYPDMTSVTFNLEGDDLTPGSITIFALKDSGLDERIAQLPTPWQDYVRSVIAWMRDNGCRNGSVGLFGASTGTEGLGARVITVCFRPAPTELLNEFPDTVQRLLTQALGDIVQT